MVNLTDDTIEGLKKRFEDHIHDGVDSSKLNTKDMPGVNVVTALPSTGQQGQVAIYNNALYTFISGAWTNITAGFSKFAYGSASYTSTNNGNTYAQTCTDIPTSATFSPKVILALGSDGSSGSMGWCLINNNNISVQKSVRFVSGAAYSKLAQIYVSPGAIGVTVASANASSFSWTVDTSGGYSGTLTVDWIALA